MRRLVYGLRLKGYGEENVFGSLSLAKREVPRQSVLRCQEVPGSQSRCKNSPINPRVGGC